MIFSNLLIIRVYITFSLNFINIILKSYSMDINSNTIIMMSMIISMKE